MDIDVLMGITRNLLCSGDKIGAVDLYKCETSCSMEEAVHIIDQEEETILLASPTPNHEVLMEKVRTLLKHRNNGSRIKAIGLYKRTINCSIDEAKRAVDRENETLELFTQLMKSRQRS